MNETLRIRLLGPFEIFQDGQPLTNADWQSQQTRTICKMLLARHNRVVTSDQLIELLWPADDPDSARRRLHVRISQLRRALRSGKSRLKTVDGGYLFHIDQTCWLDVDQFQSRVLEGARHLESGQQLQAIRAYEQARQLYRGDFLAEDLYADWAYAGREYYAERFLTLLIELSECYAQQGRYRLAIARAQEALARDPLRETIYVRLMLYHYYAGERDQALRTFERCQTILAAELDVPPLETTLQLDEQIRAGTLWSSPEAPRYPPPIYTGRLFEVPYVLGEMPLVGREREYAWLVAQWQDPTHRVILLEGEAGIGKSRLVETFAGYVTTQGTRLLRTRVAPVESAPFAPLVSALHPLLAGHTLAQLSPTTRAVLANLFPEIRSRSENLPNLSPLPPNADRQRLYQALADLAAASITPPTLLLIDDAHRLSLTAIELLANLTGSFQLLLSYRSEETPPEHPLRRVFGQAALQLEPLSPLSAATIIRQLAGHELSELAGQISTQSGGNPLFIVALLQNLFETGQLYVAANGCWQQTEALDPDSLPPTVRSAIETRLRRLNLSQRRIFDFAAVLGGEFDFDLLQAASQQPEDILLAALDNLIASGLLIEPRQQGRPEIAIPHERYIEVTYATLPAVRRKQFHRQAAQAIEALYTGQLSTYFPALARHYDIAEIFERAAHYNALAGEQAAAQFANAEALRYLDRALELTPVENHAQHAHLLLAREKIYDLQGARQPQAADLTALEALTSHLPQRQQAEIALRRAGYEWILGNDDRANAAIIQTITLAQACKATDLEAGAYLLKGRVTQDQALARQDLAHARQLAQKAGLRALEGDIVRCTGNACFWQNHYAESKAYFETALSIHQEVGDLRGELSVLNNLGFISNFLGASQRALFFYEQALDICHKIGDGLAEGVLLTNLGDLTAQLGNYQQAQIWLERALLIREQIKNEEGVGMLLTRLGNVARQQGQYARAQAYYEQALEINTRIQHAEQTCASFNGLGQLSRELGDYPQAQVYFEQALNTLPNQASPDRLRALANGSLVQHMLNEHAAALEMGLWAIAQSEESPAIHASALMHTGLAALGLRRAVDAAVYFRQALEIRTNLRQPHLATEPRAGLAQIALAENNLPEALAQAEAIWQICEAGPLSGPERPLWVYLTCYQIFQHAGDARANAVLSAAYALLKERTHHTVGDENRSTYLEIVPENREIIRLWQASQ